MDTLVIVVSNDNYLGSNLSRIVTEEGMRNIRSADLDRIKREVKKPDRVMIFDMAWEPIQGRGVLKQLINISRITGNTVLCVCPNQEEDLKKLSVASRADEVFIRYDLETRFRTYLKELRIKLVGKEDEG